MTRGEIWFVDLGIPFGSEAGFRRPAIIIQNDELNVTSLRTAVIVPLTSNLNLADYKGNILLPSAETQLSKDSVAVTPQVLSVDHARFIEKVSNISSSYMKKIEECIKWTFALS